MRYRNIVRRCQNGVKRRVLPKSSRGFVRSNYVSNDTDRVKGHRAKRLFTYNCNKLKRKFDTKHSIAEGSSDEYLIEQALQHHKEYQDLREKKIEAFHDKMAKFNDCPDEYYYAQKGKELKNQLEKLAEQDRKVQMQASQRQNKRIAFLKNPKNKICFICGAKGHVSKDCKSEKKKQNRKYRAIQYKKHLIKKKVYKLDIDAEYKRLQDKIKQLEDENAKLKQTIRDDKLYHQVGSATMNSNGGKVASDPSQDEKILQSRPEYVESATMDPVDMRDSSDSRKDIYNMSYEELKTYFALKGERRRSLQAQCCTILRTLAVAIIALLLVAALLLLGGTARGVVDNLMNSHTTQEDHLNLTTSIVLFGDKGWKSQSSNPNYSLLIVILCMAGVSYIIGYNIIVKADGMVRWEAMSTYRQQLRDSGCTYRLPYRVSQLGTDEYYYTSRAVYDSVYSHLVRSMSLIQIIVYLICATMKVFSDIMGQIIFKYYFCRYICKAMFKCAKSVIRIVWAVIVLIYQVFRAIWQFILIMIAIATILFAIKYITLWGMESYTFIRNEFFNWVCQLENQTRAMFASLFGSVTLNSVGIVKLTTSAPTIARKTTYLLGLISRFLGVLRYN